MFRCYTMTLSLLVSVAGCCSMMMPYATQLEFMRPLTVAILSERRAVAPFGIAGGGSAKRGMNLVLRKDGHTVNIGAKSVVELQARRQPSSTDRRDPVLRSHMLLGPRSATCSRSCWRSRCRVLFAKAPNATAVSVARSRFEYRVAHLPNACPHELQGGDRLRILTPGGGGYYAPKPAEDGKPGANGLANGHADEHQVIACGSVLLCEPVQPMPHDSIPRCGRISLICLHVLGREACFQTMRSGCGCVQRRPPRPQREHSAPLRSGGSVHRYNSDQLSA